LCGSNFVDLRNAGPAQKLLDIPSWYWLQFVLWSNNITTEVQVKYFPVAINMRQIEEKNWLRGKRVNNTNDSGRRDNGNMDVHLSTFISIPTSAHRNSIKLILLLLRHASLSIDHPQGTYKLCQLKLLITESIKYKIVVCCYGKIVVNVAACVIQVFNE